MRKSNIKKYIYKDINNICFALSNPNKYDLTDSFTNIKTVIDHVKLLAGTMKYNIKFNVKINDILTNLWIEAEKDSVIANKINIYGKNKYLAVVLVYFSALYNTIFISNNINLENISLKCHDDHSCDNCDNCYDHYDHHHHCHNNSFVKSNINLLEHRTDKDGNNSNINSYSLSLCYEINHNKCLKKKSWNVEYNYLQSITIQQEFIDACKSSWVNSVLVGL
jgi:hypothetical protein